MKHLHRSRSHRLLAPAVAAALALSVNAQAQQQPSQQSSPQSSQQAAPSAQVQQQGVQAQQGARQEQGATASQRNEQARAGSTGASWFQQQSLRASRVIGSQVRNPQGQDIGEIEDLVVNVDDGTIRYAVLRFDPGLLSLERVYAIPAERLRLVNDRVVVDVPKERLEQSGIESAGWSRDYFSDRSRIARLDKDWGLGERAPENLARASDLMNRPIVAGVGNERIGVVEDVVLTPDRKKVQYVVVGFDRNWLGSEKRAAVSIDSLHTRGQRGEMALLADRAAVMRMRPFTDDRYGYYGDGGFVNRDSRRAMGASPAATPNR